jgi:prepilin-type N-terminal cleavage/methylation domain-containing protein
MRKIMRKESGFTLIELMVTIAIILIMASIAVPSFLSWLPRQRLRTAAADLAADIQSVKLNAIKENRNWAIVFNTAKDIYYLCSDDGDNNQWDGPIGNGGDDSSVKVVRLRRLGSGIQFIAVGGVFGVHQPHIQFDSRGLSNAVQIDLTNMMGSPSYRVQTTLGGGVLSDKL